MKVTNTVWHWRWQNHLQILKEAKGEAKYFPYIEQLRAFDKLPRELTPDQYFEDPKPKTKYTAIKQFLVDLVEKNEAERLGSGAFRTVYGFYDNPDVILKVARGQHGRSSFRMNKEDYELFKKYPSISPRVYAHDDEDWAWVYMEAIEPAVGAFSGKYQEALLATFPKLVKYILQSNLRSRINPTNTDDLMLVIATAAARLARGARRLPPTDSLMFTIKNWTDDNEDQIIANADPAFLELSKAMVEYDIAPDEIREKNVGYGKDGKLIIIDSSIFSEG
jgi:hypothetical protein